MASSVPMNMDASNIASSVSHFAQASSSTPSAQPSLPISSTVPTEEASAPAQITSSSPSTSRILDQVKHKNLLQEYAQKSNLRFPIYQTVNEGLPHAPQFRSTVLIDGKKYTNQNCFPSRKAAEQAVAKLAMESISRNIQIEVPPLIPEKTVIQKTIKETVFQKTMFCKKILCKYAFKRNLKGTKYQTIKRKELPVFVSTVVLCHKRYTGEANSQNEAEQLAATAAILANLGSSRSGKCLKVIIKSKFKNCYTSAIESVKNSRYNNTVSPVANAGHASVGAAPVAANDNEMQVAHPRCSSIVPPPRQELWMPKQEISTEDSKLSEDVSLQAGAQQQQIDARSISKNRKRKRKQAIKKSRKRKQAIKKSRLNNLPPVGKFPPNEVPPPVAALPVMTSNNKS